MANFITLVKEHLTKYEVEYICAACYFAGSFHLVGKVLKQLAKYAGQ